MAPVTGLFGKLPSYGDFVRRGWPDETVEAIDRWLSATVAAARATRDEADFDAMMRAAPLWRGYVPPGKLGPHALHLGIAPSVDRAGRLFPVAAGIAGDAAEAWSHANGAGGAVDAALYDALAGEADADAVVKRIAAAPLPGSADPPPPNVGLVAWSGRGGRCGERDSRRGAARTSAVRGPGGMNLRYRSAPRTHVGLVRKVNEDSMLARDDAALWAVADGMGGHDNGQWASQTLVAGLEAVDLRINRNGRGSAIVRAIEEGNRIIHDAASAAGRQMGTTLVVAHCDLDDVLLIWVGDSRIYRLRDRQLTQLTRDHTLVQDLVDRGALDASEAETHPMSHVLSRAVGTEPILRFDSLVEKAQAGDRYLLCSDGLTKCVPDARVAEILSAGTIEAAAERLIAESLEQGAPDNTTVVLLSAEEATARG